MYDLLNIKINNDECGLNEYLAFRLETNDIIKIKNMQNEAISPHIYALLYKCQSTTISVERSFSKLNKINAKDRNFSKKNFQCILC